MNSKILGVLAVGFLAGPIAAHAGNLPWNLTGVFTDKFESGTGFGSLPVNIGDSFSLTLTYNTSGWAPVSPAPGPSAPNRCDATRCQYNIPSLSLSSQNYAGLTPPDFNLDNPFFRLYNASIAFPGLGGASGDGYFIRGFSDDRDPAGKINYYETYSFFFGSSTLDFVASTFLNGADGPSTLPPLALLGSKSFDYCRLSAAGLLNNECDLVNLKGTFLTNSVPEPGTLALLGLGLAGLGLSRRRKAA
jgi:hypothetical protein